MFGYETIDKIFKLISQNNFEKLNEYLSSRTDKFVDYNYYYQNNISGYPYPLIQVVNDGNGINKFKCLKVLLKYNYNVNFLNKKGQTPLIISTINNDFESVKLLVENGADINILDESYGNAYDYAKLNKNIEIIEYLKTRSAYNIINKFIKNNQQLELDEYLSSLDLKNKYNSYFDGKYIGFLTKAIKYDNLDCLKILLKYNSLSQDSINVLFYWTISHGKYKALLILLNFYKNISFTKYCVIICINNNCINCLRVLLNFNPDLKLIIHEKRLDTDDTYLDFLIKKNNTKMLALFNN